MPTNTGVIDAVYVGSRSADKLYVGSTEVWSAYTPPIPVEFVAATHQANDWTDAPLSGQTAGDMIVWLAGRANGNNNTTCTGSVQGSLTTLGRKANASCSGAVFATIWDGSETFTFDHTLNAGAIPMMCKVVLRHCSAVSFVASGAIGTDAGWTEAADQNTFPAMTVGDAEMGLFLMMASNEPSVSGPYSWTGATANSAAPASSGFVGNYALSWSARRAGPGGGDAVMNITNYATSAFPIGFELLATP